MELKEKNIDLVKNAIQALNSRDMSKVSEFISPNYFDHESQVDPARAQMRGPQEFIDTVKKIRKAFSEVHYEELETIATQLRIKLVQLWP
jgi:nogalonic acid methyl ester cyclase / aklanonic acid methyl ester cyclase